MSLSESYSKNLSRSKPGVLVEGRRKSLLCGPPSWAIPPAYGTFFLRPRFFVLQILQCKLSTSSSLEWVEGPGAGIPAAVTFLVMILVQLAWPNSSEELYSISEGPTRLLPSPAFHGSFEVVHKEGLASDCPIPSVLYRCVTDDMSSLFHLLCVWEILDCGL